MKNKSISIDARMINSSGVGTYLRNIIPILGKEFRVNLFGNCVELKAYDFGINYSCYEDTRSLYSVSNFFFNDKAESDIIWFPHFNVPLVIKRKRGAKIITTIHDVYHLDNRKDIGWKKYIVSRVYFWQATKRSTTVLTVSNFSRERLVHFFPDAIDKLVTIYNGVSLMKESGRNGFMNNPYILFVGNVKPHKNIKRLIESFSLIKEEIPHKLVVVGKKDGFITADYDIVKVIEKHDLEERVYFTGFVSDQVLNDWYCKSDVLVFPSLYEGFGFPPLEAMSAGVPTTVSNIPVLREICGNASEFFDPHSPQQIAESLLNLINNLDLRAELITKGFKRVEEFTWERSRNRHLKEFTSL
ncbi:MAG: glycosyltransferase involved in cell wall biosynthesis [Parvicella sp.]|jgi:glycosyltransferase involved in cell wall biosynthesis